MNTPPENLPTPDVLQELNIIAQNLSMINGLCNASGLINRDRLKKIQDLTTDSRKRIASCVVEFKMMDKSLSLAHERISSAITEIDGVLGSGVLHHKE
jgi:hypothetical protein